MTFLPGSKYWVSEELPQPLTCFVIVVVEEIAHFCSIPWGYGTGISHVYRLSLPGRCCSVVSVSGLGSPGLPSGVRWALVFSTRQKYRSQTSTLPNTYPIQKQNKLGQFT